MQSLSYPESRAATRCRVCDTSTTDVLMDFGHRPPACLYAETEEHPPTPRPFRLDHCPHCGFVFLAQPPSPAELYSGHYWPTSNTLPEHIDALIEELVVREGLGRDDLILDIGCNDGFLLERFRARGCEDLIGVEPSQSCATSARERGLRVVNAFFDLRVAEEILASGGRPRLILCRHVIEHVPDPLTFLTAIGQLMGPTTSLVLECPSFEMSACKGDISTLWEQHISYFTLQTLQRLLARASFSVQSHRYLEHGGGSLLVQARRSAARPLAPASPKDVEVAQMFRRRAQRTIQAAKRHFQRLRKEGGSLSAWGVGPRGLSLLNLSDTARYFDILIDDNPEKQGLCVAGTQHSVVSPRALEDSQARHCVVLPLRSKAAEGKVMNRIRSLRDSPERIDPIEPVELFPDAPGDAPLFALESAGVQSDS